MIVIIGKDIDIGRREEVGKRFYGGVEERGDKIEKIGGRDGDIRMIKVIGLNNSWNWRLQLPVGGEGWDWRLPLPGEIIRMENGVGGEGAGEEGIGMGKREGGEEEEDGDDKGRRERGGGEDNVDR